ncbi:hypothetical protein ACFX2J_014918 [Malus domestica]
MEMIVKMPMGGVVFEWDGLLGGCRIHGHVETAKKAAEQVTELDLKMRNVFSMQLRKNGTMLRITTGNKCRPAYADTPPRPLRR